MDVMHCPPVQYSLDTAHTIEVTREEDANGEFGSFGFTLLFEKPPIVGTLVPGGAAQRAGLKKDDIVLSVNGTDVRHFPHQKVVSLISQTPTAAVWLKVCDPDNKPPTGLPQNLGAFGSMSNSTPNFPRSTPTGGSHRRPAAGVRGVGGATWEPPPKYSEVPQNRPRPGSAGLQLGPRVVVGGPGGVANMSPLNRQVLMPSSTKLGLSSSPHLGGSGPLPQNGYAGPRQPPSSSDNYYSSASVMVLYIGPVEIPESWGIRGISSKCIQECTRRLLSQRQEFIEAFLEVSVTSMKVLNVSRNVLYQHKREELFYCGTCTDDEQYFAIVTRRLDPKLVDPEVGQTLHTGDRPAKGHMCHVFQVIRNKSILVLHAGDRTGNGGDAPNVKPKTVQILSCLTIIKAIEALFIGDATGGAVSSAQIIGGDPGINSSSSTSFRSLGSSESAGSLESFQIYGGAGGPDKNRRRKDVVDLRPSAFTHLHSSSPLTYDSGSGRGGPTYLPQDPAHRSRDYLHPMDTPAFSAMVSTSRSWYKVDSPREGGGHSRQGSYEIVSRPDSACYYDSHYDPPPPQQRDRPPDSRRAGPAFDKVKKISDESSISSHSSGGGAVSPNKAAPLNRASDSPSPSKSMSHSSGSRSPSPARPKQPHHPHRSHRPHHSHQRREHHRGVPDSLSRRRMMLAHHTPSKLSSGMALELGSLRSGALSPTSSTVGSTVSSRYRSTLRRQGSESSIMDLNQVESMRSGGPAKNGLLTSSQGSIMTVTTVTDEESQEPQELGRVGGWIASFDKLLGDPLGVTCLQQFLEKEHCEENVLFWKEAREYSEKALQMSTVQLQTAAKKIYDQYLSPSSPHTVNVDDRAMKAVESKLDKPTPNMFAEAKEQIYQLLKMDCYMRFKKSELVKECLLAEMEGEPLPIGPIVPAAKNPWKRQKEFGFSRSLFGRFGRNRGVPPSPPLQRTGPKTKKDSKAGLKDSPGSRKTSRGGDSSGSLEKKRSSSEMARPEEFPPETHLDILQEHKGNIFEVNLPNKVTKIMEVPKKGTVREALHPVLKKNNYSLDVMDLKFADTLKTVSLDSPAHILVGQHIIVLKSAQTFTATFPDGPERILPADTTPVQELVARVLKEMGSLQNFAVYLENSRVPFNGTIEASTLVSQKVTVKYLGGQYMPVDTNMEDLFHMIERLAGDTLEDQRTSPTPRNTPEPPSPAYSDRGGGAPPELQQRTRSHGSFRLSPRSSDSSPETQAKMRPRGGSTREKKLLSFTRSIGAVGSEHRSSSGDPSHSPSSSRRFKRTQSGAVLSKRQQPPPPQKDFRRTYSPPAGFGTAGKGTTSPPAPSSHPPPLPSTYHHHQQHNLGGGVYGSTPDTLNRGGRGHSPGNRVVGGNSVGHPLDSLVREASEGLPSSEQSITASHGRQHSMPVQMPPDSYTSSSSSGISSNWGPPHHQQANFPPNPRRYTQQQQQQQQHRTAAQRHNLTQNQELLRTGDQLVQREIEDYRHHQLTSSLASSHSDASSSSAASRPRVTLSPTTHTLVPPDELTDSLEHYKQTETFV